MVPANYLKILGKRRGTRHSNQGVQGVQTGIMNSAQDSGSLGEETKTNNGGDDFESAFSMDKMTLDRENNLDTVTDNRNQEAVDILSEIDKS